MKWTGQWQAYALDTSLQGTALRIVITASSPVQESAPSRVTFGP